MAIPLNFSARKKKILILISHGGGGHQTTSDALQQILGGEYNIEVNPVISDILGSMDFLKHLTKGHFTGEDLYNFFLRRQNCLLKWMVSCGPYYFRWCGIEKKFDEYLRKQQELPDLIISPTPYINYGIASVAHRWDIPFLIIPTDLDGSTFLSGFPERPMHKRFKIALPYDDSEIRKITFNKVAIREEQLITTGFPIRPLFQKKYELEELAAIRAKFNLLDFYQTITLVMGAIGANLIFRHVKTLISLDPRPHQMRLQVNICVGYNKNMEKRIENLLIANEAKVLKDKTFVLKTGLVMHIRGYVKEIVELMATSDLIITKTGSCTVNEAIYLGKQLLLDYTKQSTARYLAWEQFNIPFVRRHGIGDAFTDDKQLPMLILSFLKYPGKMEKGFKLPDFKSIIKSTVQEMTTHS